MSERESKYWQGFLAGAFLGGLVGSLLALLLAPKSGRELRSDIRRRSEELYAKAREFFENAGDEAVETLNEARERARAIVQAAQEQAEVIIKDADRTLREARGRVSSTTERLREAARARAEAFRSELGGTSEDSPTS